MGTEAQALTEGLHYHAASDTPDKLAYPELTRITSGLFAVFLELKQFRCNRRLVRHVSLVDNYVFVLF
jgi:hypothetical protein